MKKKLIDYLAIGGLISCTIVIGIIVSSNKTIAYDPIKFYNRSGLATPISKIYIDTFNVSSSSGYSVDISGVGFTTVKGAHAVAMKNSSTATSVPNVSIKSITTSAVTINFTEGNGSLVNILGNNVLLGPSTAFASTSGLQVALIVFGQ